MRSVEYTIKKLIEVFPDFNDIGVRIGENIESLDELKAFFNEADDNYDQSIENMMDSLLDVLEIAEGIDDKKYCGDILKPTIEDMDKKLIDEVNSYKERVQELQESLLSSLNERNKIVKTRIENSKNINLAEERLNQGIKINELLNEVLNEMEDKN